MSRLKLKKAQIDALFLAICEMGEDPFFVVDALNPGSIVPEEFVKDGFITLNLSNRAVSNFNYDDEGFRYSANFSGKHHDVYFPYGAIVFMYPRSDHTMGFQFPIEERKIKEEPVAAPTLTKGDIAVTGKNPNANSNWAKSARVVH